MPQRRVRRVVPPLPERLARRARIMSRKTAKELPPLFFCDNCGAEVLQDEPSCPKCGRKFASIRCPACGFSGEESLFDDGCPKCGYQVLAGKGGHKNLSSHRGGRKTAYARTHDGALPVWVYFLTFAFFIFVVSFLLFYMRS
jgi:predicted RNA-binding Zn-ribbon protein involved in translation (DUF1610 family)